MNMVYRGFGYLRSMYNQLNPATLTGAIDIVVVEQQDGSYLASPFHVRFGKLGVLRAKEKLVKITVNDERIRDLHMKLGDQGEAFFVQEVPLEADDDIPMRLITSPLPSRPDTPTDKASMLTTEKQKSVENGDSISPLAADDGGKRKRRKKRKKRSMIQSSEEAGVEAANKSEEDEQLFAGNTSEDKLLDLSQKQRRISDSSEEKLSECEDIPEVHIYSPGDTTSDSDNNHKQSSIRGFLSDSEIQSGQEKEENTISPFSDSEMTVSVHHSKSGSMMWGWGQLPAANESGQESSSDDSSESASHNAPEADDPAVFRTIASPNDVKLIDTTALPPQNNKDINDTTSPPPRSIVNSNSKPAPNGLYLDDVLSLNPQEAGLYLKQPSKRIETPAVSAVLDRAASPSGGSDIDSGTDSQTHEDNASENVSAATISDTPLIPDARISLCGLPYGSASVDIDKFIEKEVNFDSFLQNPASLLNDPNLVFKIGDNFMNWQAAAPALVSLVVFKQPLTKVNIDRFVQSAQPQQSKGIVSWLFRKPKPAATDNQLRTEEKSQPHSCSSPNISKPSISRTRNLTENSKTEIEVANILNAEVRRSLSEQSLYSGNMNQFVFTSTTTVASGGKIMRKTTRLNSAQLASLGLQEGANRIQFSVTTQYQGTSKCQATIYLWKWSDKIVVSDIDGTITKSDVFGQILPVVGKDWTQGGVAQLYQNIGRNGYKFMYLSARAIGQASMTKNYLNWVDQQGVSLPPGPLFLSPTSLMIAFRREVIEKKPEKFKIDCLKDIKALFPTNPFSAGFGNKTSDVTAYTAVGIPSDRMFTINHKGELRPEVMQTYITSYNDLGETVDHFFPSLDQHVDHEFQARDFSDFSYWRDDVLNTVNEYEDFRLT